MQQSFDGSESHCYIDQINPEVSVSRNKIQCYCISLRDNHYERNLCSEEFKKIGLDVEFNIVDKSPRGGSHGCFTSHIYVLKKGLESGADYIMVLEDDVYFTVQEPEIMDRIFNFITSLDENEIWCFCLGHFTSSKSKKVTNNIVALDKCYCSHAYIVPRQTAEKLIQMEWNGIPYDIDWHNPIKQFYAPYPMIAFQRDHNSSVSNDIGKTVLNLVGFRNVAKLCELWSFRPF